MSMEERQRRTAAAPREDVQRAPRPGGRVVGQRATSDERGTRADSAADTGARGARRNSRDTEDRGADGRGAGSRKVAGRAAEGRTTAGRAEGRTAAGRGAEGWASGFRAAGVGSSGRGAASRMADGLRGRGRSVAAPVDGTGALQLDSPVRVLVEPAPAATPRLRVAPPAPVSVPRAPFIALVVAVVIAGVFGILMINTKTNENTFRISKLQEQQADLDHQQQQLEQQIADFESPGSLHAAARKLGLVQAATPASIRLPDGKIVGVPKPPDGSPAITSQQANGR
jgi:hypothetical protein